MPEGGPSQPPCGIRWSSEDESDNQAGHVVNERVSPQACRRLRQRDDAQANASEQTAVLHQEPELLPAGSSHVQGGGYDSFESWADDECDHSHHDFDEEKDESSSSRGLHAQEADSQHQGERERGLTQDTQHGEPRETPGNEEACPLDLNANQEQGGEVPSLENIHRVVGAKLGAVCMEGRSTKARPFAAQSVNSYRPFKNLTEMLLFIFAVKHQLSRVAMNDLFSILRFADGVQGDGEGEGATFDAQHVPANGEHFVSRLRQYLPLLEVWVRDVPAKQSAGVGSFAKVYDIPITHIMDHLLKSPSVMAEMRASPGGEVLDRDQAAKVGLGSEHIFAMATSPVGNARRNYMHGRLASSMPLFTSDGFISHSGRRVYVSDMVMCDFRASQQAEPRHLPCRVVRLYFDQAIGDLVVVVRRFRNAKEVLGIDQSDDTRFTRDGFVRVWEEIGAGAEVKLQGVDRVLDLCEVLSVFEVSEGRHRLPWVGGDRRSGWTFVSEGFTRKTGNHFTRVGGARNQWRRAGAEHDKYPDMRAPEVYHNEANLPFVNLPTSIYVDDFCVWGMSTPVSDGVDLFEDVRARLYQCMYQVFSEGNEGPWRVDVYEG